MMQLALMATDARPTITRATLERLASAGGLGRVELARAPRLYFAGRGPVDAIGWEVRPSPVGRPYVLAFWEALLEADPAHDLLWLEDDVWIAERGLETIAALEVPEWAGAVSFFDTRNEHPTPGLRPLPKRRPFCGSQAVKFPARVLSTLQHLARFKDLCLGEHSTRDDVAAAADSWDCWIGRAVEELGMAVALYSPSLVQHLGAAISTVFPRDHQRPIALSFPEPTPIIHEAAAVDPHWCALHEAWHTEPSSCPEFTR